MHQPKVDILTNIKNHQPKGRRERERERERESEHNRPNGPKWTEWTKVN